MRTIYIEKNIKSHPRVKDILTRLNHQGPLIECNHYGEIFNPKAQNFRLQKQNPAIILAEKTNRFVLETPEGFGIGGQQNYYFSHMLNCLYDCRYCFLQGMYPSANFVMFINYEDFMTEISETISNNGKQSSYFFSGYDCDSLAFDSATGFLDNFLPFFRDQATAILELRTKSTNIRGLLQQQSIPNCVTAFSFTPAEISQQVEHKVPAVKKRLQAMQSLAAKGWKIGLRFDPLIFASNFEDIYKSLIQQVFQHVKAKDIHSVSIGPMRFPEKMYHKIVKLYPQDKLLAHPLEKRDKSYSYQAEVEMQMKQFVLSELKNYMDQAQIFECSPLWKQH